MMSYSFEEIRAALKKYNFEENVVPPKLVIAGKNFLDIDHKKRPVSQFIIGVKEFDIAEQFLFDQFLDAIEAQTGRRPLSFHYDDRQTLEIVIRDFEDYFDVKLGNNLFQKLGSPTKGEDTRYYLVIVVTETYCYYEKLK
jgi:hypothetical protein